ncbi:MAG: hypothetical protein EOM19_01510 [Candidatus Moranbacteria bacterium]|nr:hypothetical protein [Candidatus Moranbacteria bacterium]
MNKNKKTKFKIGNLSWTAEIVKSESAELKDGALLGICRIYEKRICITEDVDKELGNRLIIHELTHAFIETYKIKKTKYSEEDVCHLIEVHLQEIAKLSNQVTTALYKVKK